MFRKTIFWMHLLCGVVTGLVVLMMSVTGVLLTYERQILAWEDRVYRAEPQPGQVRMAVSDLLLRGSDEGFRPTSVVVSSDPADPVILSAGRDGSRHLNPYTGAVYTPHSDTLDRFFSAVTGWHRWFNVSGDGRATARMITGASNLMFLFLVLSGIYLWLPSVYRWATFRMRLWFHPNARSGQARDFNWHHVFGFWSAVPLAVIVATATVFYYPWANNLVYRLAGEEPPQRNAPAPVTVTSQNTDSSTAAATGFLPLEDLLAAARTSELLGDWNTLTITLPAADAGTVTFGIDQGNGGQPQKRHTLTLDRSNAAVVSWAPFTSQTPGRQARSWVRFLHTGEALGLVGQTVAGLVSFFAVLMVWTGLALSLRRFLRWRGRLRQAARSTESESLATGN
ncbi:MAG: hypothetical protein RLZZ385_1678 [Pseudomonadota bacterium]|jgi:uncharacterized iron-regulated membrane protein